MDRHKQQQEPQWGLASPTSSRPGLLVAPQFTAKKLQNNMNDKDHIRNICVIGHVDHGKSTLADSLMAAAGLIAPDVEDDVGAHRAKSCSTYMSHKGYLINLIDSPGHADFSSEVAAAVRITDGALVVVDCIEGVCIQTETVLRQAMGDSVHPVLTVNKMDRCFLELEVASDEEVYLMLKKVVDDTNVVLDAYKDPHLGDVMVSPEKGTVAFSSVRDGWAFTIDSFANMYAAILGHDKRRELLWGDHFLDLKTNKWTTEQNEDNSRVRGFIKYIYRPIKKIIKACTEDKVRLWGMLEELQVSMEPQEKELTGSHLMKCVMQKWLLPASTVLLDMCIKNLPSPHEAQRYRVENLYKGPQEDDNYQGIRKCDPRAPLMLFVSKMIPTHVKGEFVAFGRVFSGTVRNDSRVRIMGSNGVRGHIGTVKKTAIWMGKKLVRTGSVPCGNTVAIFGLDAWDLKNETLTTEGSDHTHPIRAMKLSVSSFVVVGVKCDAPLVLPEGLRCLVKSDISVVCTNVQTKFYIAGTGEMHLKILRKDLEDFVGRAGIHFSKPFVSFRETVRATSSLIIKNKDRNKRFYVEARPLEDGLAEDIDDGKVGPGDNPTARAELLHSKFRWKMGLAMKIWDFGPGTSGPNMLVEAYEGGVGYSDQIKGSLVAGFKIASKQGCLAQEEMRGICFNLLNDASIGCVDVTTLTNAIYESQSTAEPRLLEPCYVFEILVPEGELSGVYHVLDERDGCPYSETHIEGHPYYYIKGHIPIRKSFGFSDHLKGSTKGLALSQCLFNHWDMIEADPLDKSSEAGKLVQEIRKRKGLEPL